MSNQHYNGNVIFEWNDKQYEATVNASATYSFRPGRMYMPNGDPGYPDEEDFEIEEFNVEAVFDENGDEVPYSEDMYDAIEDALYDTDGWEEDEPPEPDLDYYEERAIERWERDLDDYDL